MEGMHNTMTAISTMMQKLCVDFNELKGAQERSENRMNEVGEKVSELSAKLDDAQRSNSDRFAVLEGKIGALESQKKEEKPNVWRGDASAGSGKSPEPGVGARTVGPGGSGVGSVGGGFGRVAKRNVSESAGSGLRQGRDEDGTKDEAGQGGRRVRCRVEADELMESDEGEWKEVRGRRATRRTGGASRETSHSEDR